MIITEIQYFFSKIIRFQAIFKDTVEFTCALEFKISSQRKSTLLVVFYMKKYGKEIPFVRNLPFCAMSFSTQTMDFRV